LERLSITTGNVTNLSNLQGSLRMDAEFYKPEYINVRDAVTRSDYATIGRIAARCKKGVFSIKAETYTSSGLPFVRISNLKNGLIDDADIAFISDEAQMKEKNTEFYKEDLLLSKTAYPAASVVTFDRCNISQDIIGISLKSSWKGKLKAPFLVAFLNSYFGLSQMQQWFQGNVQMHLALSDVKRIVIPILSPQLQEEISETYSLAQREMEKSKFLFSKAHELLLKELGLAGFQLEYELSYQANLSRVFRIHRVDAEYFQPNYDHIENYLVTKFAAQPIGKIEFIDVTTGQYSDEYVTQAEGKPYIRGTDIKNGTISTDDLFYIAPEKQAESKKGREGDVVVTRVGTIGLSARIPKECDGGTTSDNLIRLRFDQRKLDSYYLSLFLGSSIGVSLMIRNSRGSVQQRLNQETLKEVVVPILPENAQQKMASCLQESHECLKNTRTLLDDAKKKVEESLRSASD